MPDQSSIEDEDSLEIEYTVDSDSTNGARSWWAIFGLITLQVLLALLTIRFSWQYIVWWSVEQELEHVDQEKASAHLQAQYTALQRQFSSIKEDDIEDLLFRTCLSVSCSLREMAITNKKSTETLLQRYGVTEGNMVRLVMDIAIYDIPILLEILRLEPHHLFLDSMEIHFFHNHALEVPKKTPDSAKILLFLYQPKPPSVLQRQNSWIETSILSVEDNELLLQASKLQEIKNFWSQYNQQLVTQDIRWKELFVELPRLLVQLKRNQGAIVYTSYSPKEKRFVVMPLQVERAEELWE
jgi:hypothetical protein